VTKRRAGRAPEGSGAPVGTAHRWYILAHQVVTKLDANSYSTEMAGLKFKLAHRRADKGSWSASERAQRKKLVALLRDVIDELERAPAVTTGAAEEGQRGDAGKEARGRSVGQEPLRREAEEGGFREAAIARRKRSAAA
jgi:hypothetical protein